MKGKDGALFFPLTVLPFANQPAAPGSGLGLVIALFNYRNILLTRRWSGESNFWEREEKEERNIFHTEKKHICGEQEVKYKVTFPAPIIFIFKHCERNQCFKRFEK